VGIEIVIFIAGLKNIPEEMYEASFIEGANELQRLRHITIPLLAPATTVAIVLTTLGCFRVFDLIYIMTGGGPAQATEVLAKITYDYAFRYNRMGFASSVSVILMIVVMMIGFTQLLYLRSKEIEQ
jgi:raffinose/stachyose/melibiose transport system permease protein